ncbi:nuclear transport factor 2 family protein [Pseudohalioglobus sediminis]|uniref:Nuclear transport factor 2 family protein n=1 Tax=Pseudohalioglobus sediminis TaxID=2606449 RepID=A0A5B0WSN3_9GAMM|nr:nuclear transport factor 2 family protein [Pseudohalioglobus sediminis]KAA1189498.1 nuclear transport factor 2 family protein [Pseudohalioglobus sediminis]
MSPERQIENLIYRYAELIDAGDLAAIGVLLQHARFIGPDGEVQGEGTDDIVQIYSAFTRLYEDGTPQSHHVTSNVLVEVDGDSATARSYFTVLQATEALPLQAVMAGCYRDTFARAGDDWHFSSRQIIPRLYGDLSAHLLQAPL